MENPNPMITDFAENYTEKLFYFCLKKTGCEEEARELTQDIALQILTALNRGTLPGHFPAWVWQIARNRYAAWADAKNRSRRTQTDPEALELEDPADRPDELIIRREQLALLRRELAFISAEYREVVVAHYFHQQGVRDIARSLGLSESAVKQRLYRARTIMKEGMNMARTFGTRSYRPEEINYSLNLVRLGEKRQPNSLMEHLLYENIFLEAYGNPSTPEELALELGVALPYMETELAFLARETVLLEQNGRYQTAFPIISAPTQEAIRDAHLTAIPDITRALAALLDRLDAAFAGMNYRYYGPYTDRENARWPLLLLAFDRLLWWEARQTNAKSQHHKQCKIAVGLRKLHDASCFFFVFFNSTLYCYSHKKEV